MSINGIQFARADETTVPCRVIVRYQDAARDYQTGSQASRPLTGIGSQQIVTLDLPLVLDASTAKQLAEIKLRNAHTERNSGTLAVPLSFLGLEPADVVQVIGRDASQLKLRITSATFDGIKVDLAAVVEDSVYTSAAQGDAGAFPDQSVGFVGPTEYLMLDIPPLRNEDGVSPALYVAMSGVLSGWRGGVLYRSPDSSAWTADLTVTLAACFGTSSTALAAWSGGGQLDTLNTVRVTVNGELTSYTIDQLLQGREVGAYLIGDEIVQAAKAVLVSAGVYDLSLLIRGQQGTGWAMGTHQIGERAVLLDTRLRLSPIPLTSIGQRLYYRADSLGSDVGSGETTAIVPTNATIRPLMPALLRAIVTVGDYDVRWFRSARINNVWRNGGDVPLDEATEVYRLRILVAGVEKRSATITGVTNFSYTAAMQTADAVTSGVVFTIEVCQISDESIVGYPATITLTR
ncbi:phage tail protein [Chitiniphilus eburneus]|uniref:phage tail protein n=1 Tax=Chitiniphilus eburneus TaxID=2571148 RepID=UPI0035D13019